MCYDNDPKPKYHIGQTVYRIQLKRNIFVMGVIGKITSYTVSRNSITYCVCDPIHGGGMYNECLIRPYDEAKTERDRLNATPKK